MFKKAIQNRIGVVSDSLLSQIINDNLEVRTSVAIDPNTATAAEGSIFSYEALPKGTILLWNMTCKNALLFKPNNVNILDINNVYHTVIKAHPYFEFLGIGGLGRHHSIDRMKTLNSVA